MEDGLGKTVWQLIENQARRDHARTAIIDGENEVTYEQLIQRSAAIASELNRRGIEAGSLVGVCMQRSWELVATLLGVLRAACAYVPLDPMYPPQRLRYMLEHSRAACAIVDDESRGMLCDSVPVLIRLDQLAGSTTLPEVALSADDLAYVIYTSGSTGRPKGVAVEHRSIVAMSQAMRDLLDDDELAGVLAAASVCFDPSVMEILGTLSLGGTVVLAKNVLQLLELPAAHRVRTGIMVPSAMQALLKAGHLPEGLRCLVFGGEVLKRSLVNQLHDQRPELRIVNVYGPTEDTVFSTAKEISVTTEIITIGKAIRNSRAYVLDEMQQPVAVGKPGELYLAGEKLARGYLHDDSLTEERFIVLDGDGAVPENRLYRTGDQCQWREDGELEFLGRIDQQVKVRGFRIELEEIESILESMDGVTEAAVAVTEGVAGQRMLAAYVVSGPAPVSRDAVRLYLAEWLPGYMVPQVVIALEVVPRLPNGKLDRSRLPAPDVSEDLIAFAPSSTDAMNQASVWVGEPMRRLAGLAPPERHAALLSIIRSEIASILSLRDPEHVPLEHSLDELGIDSLTAVELSTRLAAVIEHQLPVSVLMQRLTPAAMADYLLDRIGDVAEPPQPQAQPGLTETLSRFQEQLLYCHPPFLAAKAQAWSATDKGVFVEELKRSVNRHGRDPYGKVVRTGSGHRGVVADAKGDEEREAIIWTTNLYLGLNRDQGVIHEARTALEQLGTGMGTSAAASGITDLHLDFEKAFAEVVGMPAACLFPTGFTANLGTVAGLLGSNDVVVMDQLCHASIVDGARLCGAKIRTFRHNCPADLETVLKSEMSPYRTVLVVMESVYSMGEGAAPLAELVRMAKKYQALVLVDEAHSFGFYGPRGAGLCADQGVTDQVDFIMTTLSKAMGSLGGVVAAREAHVALLKASARSYIFQASASPADIAAALAALRRLSQDDALRQRLWDTTRYMRERFAAAGYDLGSGDGPIVTPHFSDKEKLYALVDGLFQRGVHTAAVTYPIVESGRGRLRFICSAAHTREDVDRTLAALIEAEREVDQMRLSSRNDNDGSVPDSAAVASWARAFATWLERRLASTTMQQPEMTLLLNYPGLAEPIAVILKANKVTMGNAAVVQTSYCCLNLSNHQAVSSLCSTDVSGWLHTVVQGNCEARGQIEAFIWFVARMAEWSRS
ncbi:MAG: hypothetical protein Tsb002_32580 [Wenzhouxiangellaceae bacterium]